MPVFLLPLLKYVLAPLLIISVVWGYLHHIRASAYAEGHNAAVAEVQKATDAESARRMAALEDAQAVAQRAAADLETKEKDNAALLARVNQLSRANDRRGCLNRVSVDRLRLIGARRRAASR